VINTSTLEIIKLDSIVEEEEGKPKPRKSSSSCFVGNQMIIFGGQNKKNILGDIWSVDTMKLKVQKLIKNVPELLLSIEKKKDIAESFFKLGQFEKAINYISNEFKSQIEDKETESNYYIVRGKCYYAIGEYEKSINDFQSSKSKYQELDLLKAQCYISLGRYNEALSNIEYALEKDPENKSLKTIFDYTIKYQNELEEQREKYKFKPSINESKKDISKEKDKSKKIIVIGCAGKKNTKKKDQEGRHSYCIWSRY
jgi:tetratricopeptide (TPR) repeat protein